MIEETQVSEIAEPVSAETLDDIQRDEKGNTARDRWLKGGSDEIPAIERKPVVKIEEKKVIKQKGPEDTEKRFQELLADRKKEKERADKLEAELTEAKKSGIAKVEEKKVEVSAELKEPERPKRPRRAEFASDELYEAALDNHETSLLEYPAKRAAFDKAKADNEKQVTSFKEREQKITEKWKTIAEKGRALFEDWDKVAFEPNLPIVEHDPIERYLRDSEPEIAARLLQHLGSNKKELERIIKLSSREQFKEMEKIEAELEPGEKKEEKEVKKEEKKAEVKEITQAKKPPVTVGGRGTTPEDEEEAALKNGDTDRYRELANRRALQERKRGVR